MGRIFEHKGVSIEWFGHSSFLIEYENEAIYIDNYVLPEKNKKKATIIIHTHSHYDHCVETKEIVNEKTVYLGRCKHSNNLIGDKIDVGNAKIEFVDAYNIAKPFHPKGAGCGVIITLGSVRIYHAGDTDYIPEMEQYKCNIALVPIGGTFTMDEKEALSLVKVIKPEIAIPMHYNFLPQTRADPYYFEKLVKQNAPNTKVIIL